MIAAAEYVVAKQRASGGSGYVAALRRASLPLRQQTLSLQVRYMGMQRLDHIGLQALALQRSGGFQLLRQVRGDTTDVENLGRFGARGRHGRGS